MNIEEYAGLLLNEYWVNVMYRTSDIGIVEGKVRELKDVCEIWMDYEFEQSNTFFRKTNLNSILHMRSLQEIVEECEVALG